MKPEEYLKACFGLEGKVAVVIGGTGELCGAMAEGLAGAGAEVVLVGRSREKADARLARIAAAGGRGWFHSADAGSRAELEALRDAVLQRSGRIDIVVNGAGINSATPFVRSHYPVDDGRQAIFGMSNGGVAVLRLLFRHPEAFQTYIAGSPAIYHNDRAVLADEAAFSAQIRTGNLQLKLLITTAANEQYRGNDPKLLAADGRFVDNAAELAARLAPLNPATFKVVYTSFADETHKSASLPALSRALTFALKPD